MVDADMVSSCLHVLVLAISADLTVGMEELELHYRCRDRSNFRKIRIATISVRMILSNVLGLEQVSHDYPLTHNYYLQKTVLKYVFG